MTKLEEALSDLKRRGSATLVVGTVPHDAYTRVSRRMLGSRGTDRPRRRLLVVPESHREEAVERLRETGPMDPGHARLVTCNGTSRSVAARGASGEDGVAVRRVEGSIDDLGAAITESIDRLDDAAGGLSPAELRVGVDPDTPFERYDTPAAFGFFHVLAEQVRRVDGMAHVRVPRDRTDESVLTLSPLFDAVLELRLGGYRLEQRWHVREHDLVSDWHPLPDPVDADGG